MMEGLEWSGKTINSENCLLYVCGGEVIDEEATDDHCYGTIKR